MSGAHPKGQGGDAILVGSRMDEGYTVMPNSTVRGSGLTMAGLGLLISLVDRSTTPGGWTFYVTEIATHFAGGKNGDGVKARLRELERVGYLYRTQGRDEMGRMGKSVWVISARPIFAGKEGQERARQEIAARRGEHIPNPKIGTEPAQVVNERGSLPETDLFGTPTLPSQPGEPKASKKKSRQEVGERVKQSDFEGEVIKLWNTSDPGRWVNKRAISTDERRLLEELVQAHGGNEKLALETLREAAEQVAWYGTPEGEDDPRALFWNGKDGQGKGTHPALVNLLSGAKWVKHAEARSARRKDEARALARKEEFTQAFNIADFGV